MRPLLLLSVVVVAFLAVRCFRPAAAEAGEPEQAAQPEQTAAPEEPPVARFLAPPPREGAAGPVAGSGGPAAAAAQPAEAPKAAETAWPANLVSAGATESRDEVRLASALLHGSPADVQALTAGIAQDRALLLESFAWVLAGEKQMAVSLSGKIGAKEALDRRECSLFEAALTGASAGRPSADSAPVALAMELGLLAGEARRALEQRDFPAAADAYSTLLRAEVGAPWQADRRLLAAWSEGLAAAQREHRWNPRSAWPAVEATVQGGDSLISIRKRYVGEHPGALLCTGLIERANRIKGHLQPGQVLRIPTDPARVVVDLQDRWALYFLGNEVVAAWPVGIGRPGEDTPPGDYVVRNKLENPPWMKEGQEPIPFGDPRNPLGTRWLGWSTPDGGRTSYGFHGTWEPDSIGQAASDGCIRLRNEDVEELFQILPEGAPIRIQG